MEHEKLNEIKIEKINQEIKEIKLNMNKKEDDLKNLINNKDEEIIKLNNKIIMQENMLIKYENEIKKLDNKIEELIKRLNDTINKKDIKINLLNNILLNQDCQIKEIKENLIKKNDVNEFIVNNKKYNFVNEMLIEVGKAMNELVDVEYSIKLDNTWQNLTSYEIPQEKIINSIRPFFSFFNELYEKFSLSDILNANQILNILKNTYMDLLKCSLKGELNSLFSEDIMTSKRDILKLIYSPKEFINQKVNKVCIQKNLETKLTPNESDLENILLESVFSNYNFNFLSYPINKSYYINYDNLNINSSLLSIPIISKVDGVLKCNYNKISIQKGPFYSEFYSKPMILNIMSLVNEDLEAEIHEIYEKENEENNNSNLFDEKIVEIERKDDEKNKYMKVKNIIKANENILIEIYFPKNVNKQEIENQKIRRILELKSKETHFQIEIEVKILTLPIKLLLSCNNYKLEYMNNNYYLKTNQLYSKEELIFNIQNYFEEVKIKFKNTIDSFPLEGNTSPKPKIILRDNKIKINLSKMKNNEEKRLNYKIVFYFNKTYKIPIIIDSVIMPLENIFQVYDFLNKCFISEKLDLIIPNQNEGIFYYIGENKLEINLHFLIITPHDIKDKNLKAIIQVKSKQKNIFFEFKKKEIELEEHKTEFVCKMIIDYNNLKEYEIGYFICNIKGHVHKILIRTKGFEKDMKNKVDLFRLDDYNEDNKIFKWNKITINELRIEKGIYICPFGQWNNQIIRYIKDFDEQKRIFYKLEPIPKKNNIFFISNYGEISKEKSNFHPIIHGFIFREEKYPFFGSFENDWYPLIPYYEDEKELFGLLDDFNTLEDKYFSFLNKGEDYNFYKFIGKYYPYSYNCLKFERNKYMRNIGKEFLQYLYQRMNENKIIDVLKRFRNMKSDSFSFSYLANLIFETPKNILECIKIYFPESIKSQVNQDLEYLLNDSNNINKDKYNLSLYNIIFKLYKIFKNKKEEIENNNNIFNFSNLDLNEIDKKVKELNDKFYTYDAKEVKMSKFEETIKDILKSKEEAKKNKEENTPLITASKFLIIDNDRKEVDINTKPIEKLDIPKNNFNNLVEIDEIIQPKILSINSIIEFFENCIYKTQIFPPYIRYIVINKNEDLKIKATNIFSELYNIYKSLKNYNHPIISKRIDEYKKSFEIMLSKLKQSGIDFSEDNELNQFNSINYFQIQDFIIEPKMD